MDNLTNPIVNEIKVQDETVVAAKALVVSHMEKLETIKRDRRNAREMLAQLYTSDEGFKKSQEELKKVKLEHKVVENKLAQKKEVYELKDKIKDFTRQYNDTKRAISDYLTVYETKTGQLSFFKPDGDEVKIVKIAKPIVVKKKWIK